MKDWTDRLSTPGINGIKPAPRRIGDIEAGQTMLVPTARQVDVRSLRQGLASRHGAEMTCPVTIGYHLRTVAERRRREGLRG